MSSPSGRGLFSHMRTDGDGGSIREPRDGTLTVRADAAGARANLRTLDALARMHLMARRQGIALRLDNVPVALRDLIRAAGLDDVLLPDDT